MKKPETKIVYCKCGAPNEVSNMFLAEKGEMMECPECWGGGILKKLNDLREKVKKKVEDENCPIK